MSQETDKDLKSHMTQIVNKLGQLEKRIHILESENGRILQLLQNFQTELFLNEATALYPDKVLRKRKTLKGVVSALAQAMASSSMPGSTIITQRPNLGVIP